ncbi:MAG: LPXTG cell wall anchor domain-containing protein, partial [Candidatus Ancillula sp.]|nr:LPXTG cell wall anchor domain-containing protein [Candidatus Ancillula sp.]
GAWVDANGNVHANQNGTITIILHEKLHDGKTVEAKLEDYKLTSSVDTDIIDNNTVTFPHASPHIITVSLKSNSALTTQVLVEVEPASVPDPNPTPDNPTVDPNTPSTPTNPINPSTNNASAVGTVAQTGVNTGVLGLVMLLMLLVGAGFVGARRKMV